MTTLTARQYDELKADAPFEAGVYARANGMLRDYGCHFGMRSTRDRDAAEFYRGYDAEDTVAVWPRGYAHEEGTTKIKVPAGTTEADIERIVRKQFGSFASVSGITRARALVASVTEEQAAAYRKHDNT